MTDARMAAPASAGWLTGFLGEARAAITRRILLPAAALLAVLTATNIVLLLNLPAPGERAGGVAVLAGAARLAGLLVFLVPLVRILAGSRRPPWRPDGAFFLFAPFVILSLALGAALILAFGDPFDPVRIALRTAATTLILSPLAPWIVGIVAAVPLGLSPTRFLRDFRLWLPPLLIWSLLLVTPVAWLHAVIDVALLQERVEWFWTAAVADGLLSTLLVVLTYALYAAAYRRVARG
ncbi:MAG TPA: hypothetical protein VGB79_05660 [Allosphingosinicella sp.]|jgi:hypothetical protein